MLIIINSSCRIQFLVVLGEATPVTGLRRRIAYARCYG